MVCCPWDIITISPLMANSLGLLLVIVSGAAPPIFSFTAGHRGLYLMKGLLSTTPAVHWFRVCMAIKITITFGLFKTWVKIVHMLGVSELVKISPLQWIKTLVKTCLL